MNKCIFILLMLLSSAEIMYSQNKVIQGRVIYEDDFAPIPNALIFICDSIRIGKTEMDGSFRVEIPSSINNLRICFYGYEDADLELSDDCSYIEVIMLLAFSSEYSLKKADRIRWKSFKKLPKLHKEAYEKGIFQSPDACYIQEFRKYSKKRNDF